ncbi:MAG: hypothetical protein VX959_00455, partial [Candidatus Thermoplasmatota archaeon]|nr:hypothetical protein [Candidatus Thermoplasmatota archaeon]
ASMDIILSLWTPLWTTSMGSVRTISLALACGENVARRLTSISTTIAKPLFLVDIRSLARCR